MKRVLTWFAGVIGVAAAGRLLARRRHKAPAVAEPGADPAADPAGELRQRLAEQRATDPDAAAVPGESLDERRARIHAKAREAIDSMGDGGGSAA